jgi:hypothetical protein
VKQKALPLNVSLHRTFNYIEMKHMGKQESCKEQNLQLSQLLSVFSVVRPYAYFAKSIYT